MTIENVLKTVDHTLLSVGATWDDVRTVCDDAVKYGTASVCIAPVFVKKAREYVGGKVPICTVVGFPNGYTTTQAKVFEASDAIKNGADEVDMVICNGLVKMGQYDEILAEINAVKEACGNHILKVIVETSQLSKKEKMKICDIVSRSTAEYIKTSTGLVGGGATKEDVQLFKEHIFGDTKIKAAGGIASLDDAREFIALGADRLGTSRIVAIAKQDER